MGLRARWFLGALAVSVASCARAPAETWGVEVVWEVPPRSENEPCDGGSTESRSWAARPPVPLSALDPANLASDSLRWFTSSPEAAEWADEPSAQLELRYSSVERDVRARRTADASGAWDDELRSWLACFPPDEDGTPEEGRSFWWWRVELGEHGEVRGTESDSEHAEASLRAALERVRGQDVLRPTRCTLGWNERTSTHEMNVFGEDAPPEEVGELVARVQAKIAKERY